VEDNPYQVGHGDRVGLGEGLASDSFVVGGHEVDHGGHHEAHRDLHEDHQDLVGHLVDLEVRGVQEVPVPSNLAVVG